MAVALPYYPRKYTCEWLETLRKDTGVWTDLDLEVYGEGVFPESDGEPLGETDWHIKALLDTLETLQRHFADQPEIYIAGDNFLYWNENSRKVCISPDVYVVKGAGNRPRRVFQTWEEGGLLPNIVFEITSQSTRENDFEAKFFLYEQELRVPEYFLFDPEGDYLDPPLIGYRLSEGEYQPIPIRYGRGYSEQLDLELEAEGANIRFIVPGTGQRNPLPPELVEMVEIERQRADAEATRADAEATARQEAEAEIARLRAELDALRQTEH